MGLGKLFKMKGAINVAAGVGFGALDFHLAKKEGKSNAVAAGRAGLNFAAFGLLPQVGWTMTAFELSKATQGLWEGYLNTKNSNAHGRYYTANFGGNFVDTSNRATMRQRAIDHIQSSRMNARSVLGKEARYINQNFREDRY